MKRWASFLGLVLSFSFLNGLVYSEGERSAQVIGPFGSLNNADSAFTIPADKAQDLLNVDITPGGKSVKKRSGYGTAFTLSVDTSAVHGVYNFYESGGADVSLFFNANHMSSSISGASPTVIFSTGPLNATYQCVDSAGYAYCSNTERTSIIKTNGTTHTAVITPATGTLVSVTPERLVTAGFSDFPSRIDFSKANDFGTWAPGGNPTDPINFTITAPGAKITHITYAHGRIYWFKESSFGYILEGLTHPQWQVRTLNSGIGTIYNTSIFRDDILYFQGQDGHFYAWDGSSLVKLSRDIQGTIDQTQGRVANSWDQTSQTDFETSSITPSGFLSASITAGSLMLSSYTKTETTSADFLTGTLSNTQISGNSVFLSTDNSNVTNNGFETGSGATITSGWTQSSVGQAARQTGSAAFDSCTLAPRTGSAVASFTGTYSESWSLTAALIDAVSGSTLTSTVVSYANNSCTYTQRTLSGEPSYIRKRVKIRFIDSSAFPGEILSDGFIHNGDAITFYTASDRTSGASFSTIYVDDVTGGASSISSGTWISSTKDTGVNLSTVTFSVGTITDDNALTHSFQDSTDGSSWTNMGTSTGMGYLAKRYIRYISSFTVTGNNDANTSLDDFSLVARSPYATYYSQINNSPSISSWDAFEANSSLNDGTLNLYIRASTDTFSIASSTPNWTSISDGAIPTASTGTYVQVKAEFTITNATQNPTLNDFTVNWFEGGASDKTYAIYHDNALWWSVASGVGASNNNKILKLDLINTGWFIYDIPMNGMLVRNQSLYFGSPSVGKVFIFGGADDDNGSAINAYWKSRDFFGDTPFLDKEFWSMSFAAGGTSGSDLDVEYTVNGSSTVAFSVPLTRGSDTFVKRNVNLPLGTVGSTINVKFGNNAANQPFEVFTGQLEYSNRRWMPQDN